jgi:hypothetical protein
MAQDELKKEVLGYIKENQKKTSREVAGALDCPACMTFFAIYNLVEEGELEAEGDAWKDKRYSKK